MLKVLTVSLHGIYNLTTIPDFENLDFKIASGLSKNLTGNFKKQVTTAEGKAQSENTSLTGRQIDCMICDFFKIDGDNEPILDFRDLPKAHLKNDTGQAFDKKLDEVSFAVADLLTIYIGESIQDAS